MVFAWIRTIKMLYIYIYIYICWKFLYHHILFENNCLQYFRVHSFICLDRICYSHVLLSHFKLPCIWFRGFIVADFIPSTGAVPSVEREISCSPHVKKEKNNPTLPTAMLWFGRFGGNDCSACSVCSARNVRHGRHACGSEARNVQHVFATYTRKA